MNSLQGTIAVIAAGIAIVLLAATPLVRAIRARPEDFKEMYLNKELEVQSWLREFARRFDTWTESMAGVVSAVLQRSPVPAGDHPSWDSYEERREPTEDDFLGFIAWIVGQPANAYGPDHLNSLRDCLSAERLDVLLEYGRLGPVELACFLEDQRMHESTRQIIQSALDGIRASEHAVAQTASAEEVDAVPVPA